MLRVIRSVAIRLDAAHVRRQFGDVRHHQITAPHRGIAFEVLADDGVTCRYRQRSRQGPLSFTQHLVLDRRADGSLVNLIERGPFAGGSLVFVVDDAGDGAAHVTATFQAPLTPLRRLLAPVIRRQIGRALETALAEDARDLESGAYAQLPAS